MLKDALLDKSKQWEDIVKIGRTHMQDAVPLTLGQEFSGYATLISDNLARFNMVLADVYKLAMIYNIVQSINMMSDSCINFTKYLLKGTEPNRSKIDQYLNESLMLVTALSPVIGYDKASHIAHYAADHYCTLKEANAKFKVVQADKFEQLIDPYKMAHPDKK